jgi:hypothetical protein
MVRDPALPCRWSRDGASAYSIGGGARPGVGPWEADVSGARGDDNRPLPITVGIGHPGKSDENEMQQKTEGTASDPEYVETVPCPEKGDDLPTPKRGALPTPKAIIESSPPYTPGGSEITGESVTEP